MTLWAAREGSSIKVGCTSGPVSFSVIEDIGAARQVWGSLGRALLEEAEQLAQLPQPAQPESPGEGL